MYELDDSRRPLLVFRLRGRLERAEIGQFQADLDAIVDNFEPHAIVYDIVDVEIPPREVLQDLLRWNRDMRMRFRENFEKRPDPIPSFAAYYMPSMLGNLLRFFQQMLPSVRAQHVVCRSVDEAVEAAENALERFGLDVPPVERAS